METEVMTREEAREMLSAVLLHFTGDGTVSDETLDLYTKIARRFGIRVLPAAPAEAKSGGAASDALVTTAAL